MPYYKQTERYFCPNHQRWYFRNRSGLRCLVNHPPGSCCHEYESEAPAPTLKETVMSEEFIQKKLVTRDRSR